MLGGNMLRGELSFLTPGPPSELTPHDVNISIYFSGIYG